jgi:hypothetical protein
MSKRNRKRDNSFNFDEPPALTLGEAADSIYNNDEKGRNLFEQLAEIDNIGLPSAEAAIVYRGQGITQLGGFQVSPVGVMMDADLSEDEWKAFFRLIQQLKSAYQWIVGDWANHGRERLNWTYQDIADFTGYAEKTIREWAYVCRQFPMSIRMDILDFGHHQVLVGLAEPDKIRWLDYAAKERLSVAKLREALGTSPTLPEDDPFGVKKFTQNTRKLSKIVQKVSRGGALSDDEAEHARQQIDLMRQWLEVAAALIDRQHES